MAMVGVVSGSLQADSQPGSFGLRWGLVVAWCRSIFIIWTGWTLAVALLWWQHHKHSHAYYYYYSVKSSSDVSFIFFYQSPSSSPAWPDQSLSFLHWACPSHPIYKCAQNVTDVFIYLKVSSCFKSRPLLGYVDKCVPVLLSLITVFVVMLVDLRQKCSRQPYGVLVNGLYRFVTWKLHFCAFLHWLGVQ